MTRVVVDVPDGSIIGFTLVYIDEYNRKCSMDQHMIDTSNTDMVTYDGKKWHDDKSGD